MLHLENGLIATDAEVIQATTSNTATYTHNIMQLVAMACSQHAVNVATHLG